MRRPGRAPAVADATFGSIPATVVLPAGEPPWPTLVFANGATPDGRAHPVVRRLTIALARSGYAAYVPDLPGIAQGELTPATLAAAVECAHTVADLPETRRGEIGLVGVSVGGTLALLVAADERLAARVSVVACIAPFTDLRKVMLLATTGMYRDADGLRPFSTPPTLAAGLARSIGAMSPDDSVRELLANRDPDRFDELMAALPADVRATISALSPVSVASRIRARVEIATAPRDKYFPVAESLALAEATQARVTVTAALQHVRPRFDVRSLVGLARLDAFFVRSLSFMQA